MPTSSARRGRCRGDSGAALAEALAAADAWQPKRLPVGGDDILALGVPAGPRVGALLAALEAWWIAQDFEPTRAACLAEARRLLALDSAGDGTRRRAPMTAESLNARDDTSR